MPPSVTATLHTDPGCPWAYSALPALRVLDWRYGDQIAWRLVVIGPSESNQRYVDRGFTPATMALGNIDFRDRFGDALRREPEAAHRVHGPRLPGRCGSPRPR